MDLATILWCSAPLLLAFAALLVAILRADRSQVNGFRAVQFITDRNGIADKYALAYVVALLVGSWLVWFAALHNRLSEWLLMGYLGAFVLGAAWKTGTASWERASGAGKEAEKPPA